MKKGKPGQRMRWHAIIDRCPNATIGVELGVFEGTLSKALLKSIPTLTLYMVDRWRTYDRREIERTPNSRMPKRPQEYFDSARQAATKVASKFGNRAMIVDASTLDAVPRVPDALDFVFVDADHSYEGCKADILAWIPKIRAGGWMFGHDYGSDRIHPDVRRAVDEIFGDRVEVDADHVWAVQM